MPAENPLKINFQTSIYGSLSRKNSKMDFNDGATEQLVQNSSGKWIPAIFVERKKNSGNGKGNG